MEALIVVLGKLLNTLAPVVVAWAAVTIRRKYKVDVDEADERRLREFARQGIAWAEEQARKAAKTESAMPLSAEKLRMAKDFVVRRATEARINKKKATAPALHDLVEAELARKRQGLTPAVPKTEAN